MADSTTRPGSIGGPTAQPLGDQVSASAPIATSNVVPDLGARLRVRVDDTWVYKDAWIDATQARLGSQKIGDELRFTFIDLEQGISEDMDVSYSDSEVVGRVEAYKTYVGNSNKQITLPFRFQTQGTKGPTLKETLESEVVYPSRWLESLKHPYLAPSGIQHAPPPVIVQMGQLIYMRAIVTAAELSWQPPFDPVTMYPYSAQVNVTFTRVRRSIGNYQYNQIGV